MKKLLLCSLLVAFSVVWMMSMAVCAEKSLIEERWDEFIEEPTLEYYNENGYLIVHNSSRER